MDDIFQTFQMHFYDFIYFLINKKSALHELMAWCLTCDKSLPQPILTKISEAIVVKWPHMTSDILVSIAWSIGLTPHQWQVIASTNPDLS